MHIYSCSSWSRQIFRAGRSARWRPCKHLHKCWRSKLSGNCRIDRSHARDIKQKISIMTAVLFIVVSTPDS